MSQHHGNASSSSSARTLPAHPPAAGLRATRHHPADPPADDDADQDDDPEPRPVAYRPGRPRPSSLHDIDHGRRGRGNGAGDSPVPAPPRGILAASSRAGAPPSATATPTAALSVLTRLNLEAQRAERRSEDDLLAHLHDGSRPGAVSTPTGSTASESASRVARRVTAPRTAGPASAGPGPPSMAAARRHYPVLRSSPPSASPGTAPSRSAGGLPAIARAEPWSASSTVTTTAPSRSSHEMAPQSILIDAPSAQRYPDTDLEGETAFHDDADLAQLAQAAATGSVVVQDPAGAVAVSQLGIGPSGTPGILAGRSTLQNTRILAPVPEASEFDHWWRRAWVWVSTMGPPVPDGHGGKRVLSTRECLLTRQGHRLMLSKRFWVHLKRRHLSYYRLHLAWFLFLVIIGGLAIYGIERNYGEPMIWIDAFYWSTTTACVTGLAPTNVQSLTKGTQALLYILVHLGSPVILSVLPVTLRRRAFTRILEQQWAAEQEEAQERYRMLRRPSHDGADGEMMPSAIRATGPSFSSTRPGYEADADPSHATHSRLRRRPRSQSSASWNPLGPHPAHHAPRDRAASLASAIQLGPDDVPSAATLNPPPPPSPVSWRRPWGSLRWILFGTSDPERPVHDEEIAIPGEAAQLAMAAASAGGAGGAAGRPPLPAMAAHSTADAGRPQGPSTAPQPSGILSAAPYTVGENNAQPTVMFSPNVTGNSALPGPHAPQAPHTATNDHEGSGPPAGGVNVNWKDRKATFSVDLSPRSAAAHAAHASTHGGGAANGSAAAPTSPVGAYGHRPYPHYGRRSLSPVRRSQDIDADDVMDAGIPISRFDTQATAMSFRVKRKKRRLFGQRQGPSEAHDSLGPGLRWSGSTSSLTLWQRVRVALGCNVRSSRGSQDFDLDSYAGDTYDSSSCVDTDYDTDTGPVHRVRAKIRQRLRERRRRHNTLAELGGVEYQALGKLQIIVPVYYFTLQALTVIFLRVLVRYDVSRAEHLENNGVNLWWWCFFMANSIFNQTGITLLDDSLFAFRNTTALLVWMSVVLLLGYTAFPIALRLIVKFLAWYNRNDVYQARVYNYLLQYPRRCFTHLFPAADNRYLVIVLLLLNIGQFIASLAIEYRAADFGKGSWYLHVFQSIATRHGGFQVVTFGLLHPAMVWIYIAAMYVSSTYPLTIAIRRSMRYNERGIIGNHRSEDAQSPHLFNAASNGIPRHARSTTAGGAGATSGHVSSDSAGPAAPSKITRPDGAAAPARLPRRSTRRGGVPSSSTVSHFRRLMLSDITAVFLVILFVMLVENNNIIAIQPTQNPFDTVTSADFSPMSVVFEVVSAYGNVGYSIGGVDFMYSLSGSWHNISKFALVLTMLLGRHRGLPDAIDRTVMLPKRRKNTRRRKRPYPPLGSDAAAWTRRHSQIPDTIQLTPARLPMASPAPGEPMPARLPSFNGQPPRIRQSPEAQAAGGGGSGDGADEDTGHHDVPMSPLHMPHSVDARWRSSEPDGLADDGPVPTLSSP